MKNFLKTKFHMVNLLFIIAFTGCREVKETSSDNKILIPHLEKHGITSRLVVGNKPFLMISGELHNSTCGGFESMRPVWKQMASKNLNSVIASVSWELTETEPGRYDFALVDSIIDGARKADLKLALIWFGSWKNSGSIYMPAWIKKDYLKYPRVKDENGKTLEILSTFGEASRDADAEAFAALMKHIKEVDSFSHTVILMQVENEIGILDHLGETPGNARRDFCDAANKSYNSQVPEQLIEYLTKNKDSLFPELYKVWSENGFKTSGTWEEIFGKSGLKPDFKDWQFYSYYTEELFMAWNYAKYVEKVASEGKKEYAIPMYVNSWLKQPATSWPGRYPSGGPLPQVIDIWRAAAPSIDFISPDIYIDEFKWVCDEFTRSSNPLFIPESRGGMQGAMRAFYAFGEYGASCFAPFGIDNPAFRVNDPVDEVYSVLKNMSPLILESQGTGKMRGFSLDSISPIADFELGDYKIKAILAGRKPKMGGGLIIMTAPGEYYVAGKEVDLFFTPRDSSFRAGILAVDEGMFKDSVWIPYRRLNGDETHASTYDGTGIKLYGNAGIQKVSLYNYK
jgi:hypothetical protein